MLFFLINFVKVNYKVALYERIYGKALYGKKIFT